MTNALDSSGQTSKQQPEAAVEAPRWIEVSERLPEPDSDEVLVWLTGGFYGLDQWQTHREDPTGLGGATLDMGLMWRTFDFEDITHWMPLPAPPETLQPDERTAP